MTWLKLSDDFADDCERAGLSDSAFRLHVEALVHTMHRVTDGRITSLELRKLASDPDPELIVSELVVRGFWHALPDGDWQIHQSMEHQLTPEQIEATRAADARRKWCERQRRRNLPGTAEDYAAYLSRRDARRDARIASWGESRRDSRLDGTRDPGRVGSGRDGVNPTAKPALNRQQENRLALESGPSSRNGSVVGELPRPTLVPGPPQREPEMYDRCQLCEDELFARPSRLSGMCGRCEVAREPTSEPDTGWSAS